MRHRKRVNESEPMDGMGLAQILLKISTAASEVVGRIDLVVFHKPQLSRDRENDAIGFLYLMLGHWKRIRERWVRRNPRLQALAQMHARLETVR